MNPWVSISLIAFVAAGLAGALGLFALLALSRRSLRAAALVPPITAVVGTVVGVAATAQEMFLSRHDLGVVLVVCLVSGAVSVGIGVLMARHLRELEDQAARLADQRARAEEAEQTRRELVSWVSHDLRTPLAGMRAMAEALEDGVVDDPQRYHRQMIVEVDRLASMVDDLFELSRIQAGSLNLVMERVSLPDIVGDVLAAAEPLAAKRGVVLDAKAPIPCTIDADQRELRRAISNLVSNAIRHTPHDGTVAVQVTAGSESEVAISVTDECGGIRAEDLQRVFEVGWRADNARTPDPDGGGGLGLAIVQGIVKAHHGDIAATNVQGGCQFVIRLPVVTA